MRTLLLILSTCGVTLCVDALHAQRAGANCSEVQARARAIQQVIDTGVGVPPSLRQWVGVRALAPVGDRGRTVRYEARIDEKGSPIPSTVRILGVLDVGFERSMRRHLEKNRFFPAQIDGCDVEGRVEIPLNILANGAVNAPEFRGRNPRVAGTAVEPSVGPECADVRARAKSQQLLETERLAPPFPTRMMMPPLPSPKQVAGIPLTFTVRVDSSGTMIDSTATLTPVEPKYYYRDLLAAFRKTPLKPAVVNGCAVEGVFTMTLTVGVRRPL